MTESQNQNVTIHNVRLDSDFTITCNATAEDRNLSWEAKGLLWYILTRPANWAIKSWQLADLYEGEKRGNGKKAVVAILKELRDQGYIKYTKYRNEKGHWCHRYDVYPRKIVEIKEKIPEPFERAPDKRNSVEGAIITSTELTSTELTNNPSPTLPLPDSDRIKEVSSLRDSNGGFFIFKILEGLDLSEGDKRRICKKYKEADVIEAVTIASYHEPTKTYAHLLFSILNNPKGWKQESSKQKLTKEQQSALKYNERLATILPDQAKANDNVIRNKGYVMFADGKSGWNQTSLTSDYFETDFIAYSKILETLIKERNKK